MRSWMICFVAGVAAATWQPALIPLLGCISIALLAFGVLFYRALPERIAISALLFGFLYTTLWGHWQISHRLAEVHLRSDWDVKGEVISIPQRSGDTLRFILSVDELAPVTVTNHPQPKLRKIRLSWYKPPFTLRSGQKLRLRLRLKPPHGLVNPGGFDYERWLFIRSIDATGYVREYFAVEPATGMGIDQWREQINQRISALHVEPQHAALFLALVSGDKQQLTPEQWEQLRRSGTVHLAVISGLHIGFMALVGWWLGRLITLVQPRWSRAASYLLSLFLAGGYMLVAGAELPTQRAFIMITILLLSGWRLRYFSHWQRWWLALLAAVLFSPLALWETGFWLSFAAVAVLIWCGQLYRVGWREGVKLQFLLLAAMLPLYLVFFAAFSMVAPLVNLLAIPLVSVLVPLEFLNLLTGGVLTALCDGLATLFWWLVESASGSRWAYIELRGMGLWSLLMIIVAAVLIVLPRGILPKPLIVIFLLPLLLPAAKPQEEGFSAWVYDIGQGLAVLVKVGDYHLLYDTGPSYRSGGSAFDRVIAPHWQTLGFKSLDGVVLSHNDNDHVGGFNALQQQYGMGKVYSSYPVPLAYQACKAGVQWQVKGVQFSFLAGSEGENDNDRSCVLEVRYGNCSLLLPGDIGVQQEQRLALQQPLTWLVAAHHGSRTSTSEQFLRRVKPQAIIFSAGYGNPFKHPHDDVVNRARQQGLKLFNTAEQGAVLLRATDTRECLSESLRNEQKRFWRSFQSM